MYTNETIRVALEAKGWGQLTISRLVEDVQKISFWSHADANKVDIHLQLVEDLTDVGNEPKLFIHSYDKGWLPIKVEDLT